MSNLNITNNLKIKNQFVKNSNNKLNINHGLIGTLLNIFYDFTFTNDHITTTIQNNKVIKIDCTKKLNMKENKDTIQFKNQIKDEILYYLNDDKIKNNSEDKKYIDKQINFVIHILETFIEKLVSLSTEEKYEYENPPIIPENIQKKRHDFNYSEKLKLELLELYSNLTLYSSTYYMDDFTYFNLVNTESLLYQVIKEIVHKNNNNLFNINDLLKKPIATFFARKNQRYPNKNVNNDINYISISIFMNILRYVKDYLFTIYVHQNKTFRFFLQELNLIKNNKIVFHHLNLNNFEDLYILYQKIFEKSNNNINNINNFNKQNETNESSNEAFKEENIKNYKNKSYGENIIINNSSNKKVSNYCNNIYFISGHGGMYTNTLYLMRDPYILSFMNDLNSFGIQNHENIIISSFINQKNGKETFKNINDAKNYYYGMFVPYQTFTLEFIENKNNTKCNKNNKWLYSGIIPFKDAFKRFDKSLNKEESSNFCFYNNSNPKLSNKIIKRNYSFSQMTEERKEKLKKIIYKYNDSSIISNYYLMVNNDLNLDELVNFISKSKSVKENSRFIFNCCRKFTSNVNKITEINNNLSQFVNKITEIHNKINGLTNSNSSSNSDSNISNNTSISSSAIRLKSKDNSMYNIFNIIEYVVKNVFKYESFNTIYEVRLTNNIIKTSVNNKLSNKEIYTLIKFINDISNPCVYTFDLIKVNNSLDIILKLLQNNQK